MAEAAQGAWAQVRSEQQARFWSEHEVLGKALDAFAVVCPELSSPRTELEERLDAAVDEISSVGAMDGAGALERLAMLFGAMSTLRASAKVLTNNLNELSRRYVIEVVRAHLPADAATDDSRVKAARTLMQAIGYALIFPASGERYDSVRHKADSVERDSGVSPGHVVRLMRLGYAKGGNVVEKASIVVSQ